MTIVAAEMLAAHSGLGFIIWDAQIMLRRIGSSLPLSHCVSWDSAWIAWFKLSRAACWLTTR